MDYSLKDTQVYEAQLVDDTLGVETVLGAVLFKMAELVVSKGEFIYRQVDLREDMFPKTEQKKSPLEVPFLGILGIEEKDGYKEAIEFVLQTTIPHAEEACFY